MDDACAVHPGQHRACQKEASGARGQAQKHRLRGAHQGAHLQPAVPGHDPAGRARRRLDDDQRTLIAPRAVCFQRGTTAACSPDSDTSSSSMVQSK
eukprot:5795499-Pyramimonas_sp.AAC.1